MTAYRLWKGRTLKKVEYSSKSNPHVGKFDCPICSKAVPAWKSSGMSEQWPHFYCSCCSNAIQRRADQRLIWEVRSPKKLKEIAESLPDCACGGKFVPDSNPKCPTCKYEFRHHATALERLSDPHIILVNGAVKYGDNGPEYQLTIIDEM